MCVMNRFGAAPCQCSSPGSKKTRSPGLIDSTGPPRRWHRPEPSSTQIVWPFGCVCPAVRAPGVKWTLLARTREAPVGAASGVIMLALLLLGTGEALARANGLRNVLLGFANGVASVGFALLAPVEWLAIVPLAAGLFIGGRLGPIVVRHAPAGALRALIGLAGLTLAVVLAIDAY